MRLPKSFYTRDDVVAVSRDLLGKRLCTSVNGGIAKVIITETEAYAGVGDRASHAFGGRRTARTEPMFAEGGIAYVYLCYGIHHLFNIVTSVEDTPHAVLIRAAVPVAGEKLMRRRRGRKQGDRSLLAGPGCVSQALGITTRLSGTSLLGERIWLEDAGLDPGTIMVTSGPRVGVGYAGEDASRPYRFIATL